jgi:endonuclease YncB( thermonuclease family)
MNLSKLVNTLPLLIIGAIAYYGCSKTKPVSLLPQNNQFAAELPGEKLEDNPTANLPEYEVIAKSVHDGDTMRVRSAQGQVLKIRFACIDAPELKQQLGIESRDKLRSLINKANNRVKIQIVDTDRYGRSVAEVWTKEGLVQSSMVSNGMAFAYDAYSKNCPHWSAVKSSEQTAIEYKLGVWSSPNFIKPWDWRRASK